LGRRVAIARRGIGAVFSVQAHDQQDADPNYDYKRDCLQRHDRYPLLAPGDAVCDGCRLPPGGYQKKEALVRDSTLSRSG
jgi:hypothetical protein